METAKGSDSPTDAERVTLPSPVELAVIAAALLPRGAVIQSEQKTRAMETAMELYFEATWFIQNLPSKPEDLWPRFGGDGYSLKLAEDHDHRVWGPDALRFTPTTYHDPSDTFRVVLDELFQAAGVQTNPWKTERSVRENLDSFLKALYARTRHDWVQKVRRREGGKAIYVIPRFLVDALVHQFKHRRTEAKQRSAATRKENESREKMARKARQKK